MMMQSNMGKEERNDALDKVLRFTIKEIEKRVDAVIKNSSSENRHYLGTDLEVYSQMRRLAHNNEFDTTNYDAQLNEIVERLK
jgi:hypothetical protein